MRAIVVRRRERDGRGIKAGRGGTEANRLIVLLSAR
jgi:hypothetical protein